MLCHNHTSSSDGRHGVRMLRTCTLVRCAVVPLVRQRCVKRGPVAPECQGTTPMCEGDSYRVTHQPPYMLQHVHHATPDHTRHRVRITITSGDHCHTRRRQRNNTGVVVYSEHSRALYVYSAHLPINTHSVTTRPRTDTAPTAFQPARSTEVCSTGVVPVVHSLDTHHSTFH